MAAVATIEASFLDRPSAALFLTARRRVAADLFHEGGHILFLDAEPLRPALAVGVQAFPAFQAQVPLDGRATRAV